MSLPPDLINVLKRPGMYLPSTTSDAFVAFLMGYDAGTQGGLLVGLREWLIVKLGTGNNLAWPALLQHWLVQARAQPRSSSESETRSLELITSLLEQFSSERDAPSGLRRIFASYDAWLRRQEWYTPTSPDWLPPQ